MSGATARFHISELLQLVPGAASAGVECLPANNNLDLCRFDGRLYLAWRTAPTHFASANARIEVSSATDVKGPWRHETTVALGADVREPRWVDEGSRLHLFLMELGTDPKRFQPRRTHRVSLSTSGWTTTPIDIEPGSVPWRIRRLAGRWAMLGYRGGERMYGPRPADPTVELRWSDDLTTWTDAVDLHQGGIECELALLEGGSFVGVTRNEGPVRFGSDILTGTAVDQLVTTPIRRKLDSPNLFVWNDEPWLIARRSTAFDGAYDLAPQFVPGAIAIRINQLLWSATRKRSALFRLDPSGPRLEWVADLPSRGDTSFGAVVIEDDGSLLVADYTSPRDVGDVSWVRGQLRPTVINAVRITADRNR